MYREVALSEALETEVASEAAARARGCSGEFLPTADAARLRGALERVVPRSSPLAPAARRYLEAALANPSCSHAQRRRLVELGEIGRAAAGMRGGARTRGVRRPAGPAAPLRAPTAPLRGGGPAAPLCAPAGPHPAPAGGVGGGQGGGGGVLDRGVPRGRTDAGGSGHAAAPT